MKSVDEMHVDVRFAGWAAEHTQTVVAMPLIRSRFAV